MNLDQTQTKPLKKSLGQGVVDWFDFRHRSLGMLAFILNRLTGLALVFYLGIHLVVLSMLAGGEENWDSFLELVRSPFFLFMDVVLIAGALIHGLNGIRVALVGMGYGVRSQKSAFIFLMVVALVVLGYAAVLVFTIS
jgi:succinate dehydrogenase / fumarate reductase cytochrome b subunit